MFLFRISSPDTTPYMASTVFRGITYVRAAKDIWAASSDRLFMACNRTLDTIHVLASNKSGGTTVLRACMIIRGTTVNKTLILRSGISVLPGSHTSKPVITSPSAGNVCKVIIVLLASNDSRVTTMSLDYGLQALQGASGAVGLA